MLKNKTKLLIVTPIWLVTGLWLVFTLPTKYLGLFVAFFAAYFFFTHYRIKRMKELNK